jgi:hypothetical protein
MNKTKPRRVTSGRFSLSIAFFARAVGVALAIHTAHAGSGTLVTLNSIAGGASTSQWVWQNPLPTGNYFTGVDFTDSNNGTLVGIAGTIMHKRRRPVLDEQQSCE